MGLHKPKVKCQAGTIRRRRYREEKRINDLLNINRKKRKRNCVSEEVLRMFQFSSTCMVLS